MLNKNYHVFEDKKNKVFQIRSKHETIITEFTNEMEKEIFQKFVYIYSEGKSFANIGEFKAYFESDYPLENILNVINELQEFKILDEKEYIPSTSSLLDSQLQFWKNGDYQEWEKSQLKITTTQLAIIGNSPIQQSLGIKAQEAGFKEISLLKISEDILNESAIERIVQAADFFIIDAEEWNPLFLELFNKIAFNFNKPWLLVRGVENSKGTVGPLFLGKASGCYNCLQNRIKSNMEYLPYFQSYERYLSENKLSSRGMATPTPMYDILASVAILETIKFVTEWTLPTVYKGYLMIDMYTYDFKRHPFLKAPVCGVCTPKVDFKIAPWLEPLRVETIEQTAL